MNLADFSSERLLRIIKFSEYSFTEYLFLAIVVTGLIWSIDALFFRPRRYRKGVSLDVTKESWIVEYSRAFFPILLVVFILRSFVAEPFRIPSGSMHPTLWEGDFILVNKFNYGIRLPILRNKAFSVGNPKRGDVIVFKHAYDSESKDMIKRVIGLPGDRIQYKDKVIYVNGTPLKQIFLNETLDNNMQGQTWPVQRFEEKNDSKEKENDADAKETGSNGSGSNGSKVKEYNIFVRADSFQHKPYEYADVVVPADSYFVMGDNRDNSDDSRYWGFVKDEEILGRAFLIWMSWDSLEFNWLKKIRWHRVGNEI